MYGPKNLILVEWTTNILLVYMMIYTSYKEYI